MARPEVIKTPLGQRLRAVRKEFGDPSRVDFARQLGVTDKTLANHERGDSEPDAGVLRRYREELGVNINWLVSNIGEMFEDPSKRPQTAAGERVLDEWLLDELGKIVVREHKAARATLPPEKVAPEAGALYNELLGMVRDVADRRTVEAMLPLLAENLRGRLRDAASAPGAGKREAS